MSPRHTARGIVIHDDKLLLLERWRSGLHYFSVPGGGVELGESPEQTVVREIAEETGCTVSVDRQVYLLRLEDQSDNYIFTCKYISGEPHLPAGSPEAQHQSPDNRYKPCWLPLSELADRQFIVWQPIQRQLVHDLEHGFSSSVVALAQTA